MERVQKLQLYILMALCVSAFKRELPKAGFLGVALAKSLGYPDPQGKGVRVALDPALNELKAMLDGEPPPPTPADPGGDTWL